MYRCPAQCRLAQHNFLLCKLQMQSEVNYSDKNNAMSVVCGHQHMCGVTHRMENTEEQAKQCYEYLSHNG